MIYKQRDLSYSFLKLAGRFSTNADIPSLRSAYKQKKIREIN